MNINENISLLCNGQHRSAYYYLGAHPHSEGCTFRVWAPNADLGVRYKKFKKMGFIQI